MICGIEIALTIMGIVAIFKQKLKLTSVNSIRILRSLPNL